MHGRKSDAVQVCSNFMQREEAKRLWPLARKLRDTIANMIEELQQLWRDTHRIYFDGLIDQIKQTSKGLTCTRSVDEFIRMRRRTIGGYPAVVLAQSLGLSPSLYDRFC